MADQSQFPTCSLSLSLGFLPLVLSFLMQAWVVHWARQIAWAWHPIPICLWSLYSRTDCSQNGDHTISCSCREVLVRGRPSGHARLLITHCRLLYKKQHKISLRSKMDAGSLYPSPQSGRRSSRMCLCPVKLLLHVCQSKDIATQTYMRNRRTRTRMDLQVHERQVCTIKNWMYAVCFF